MTEHALKIDFDAEAINSQIAKAILESYLGKQFKDDLTRALSEAIRGRYGSYTSVIASAVREAVRKIAFEMLREREDEIRQMLRDVMTQEWLESRVKEVTDGIHIVTSKVD